MIACGNRCGIIKILSALKVAQVSRFFDFAQNDIEEKMPCPCHPERSPQGRSRTDLSCLPLRGRWRGLPRRKEPSQLFVLTHSPSAAYGASSLLEGAFRNFAFWRNFTFTRYKNFTIRRITSPTQKKHPKRVLFLFVFGRGNELFLVHVFFHIFAV